MTVVSISKLKKEYKGIDDEFLHEAELLIILFNFWPVVQRKWLNKLGFKPLEVDVIVRISDLFAKRKVKLMNKKLPVNRKGVILIENDVIESLYEPRIITTSNLDSAEDYLRSKHSKAVVINQERIDELEKLMNLKGRSVDFLVFTKKKIISYQLELA